MSKEKIIYHDLGIIDYKEAWDYQEKLFNETLKIKTENRSDNNSTIQKTESHLIFCEHPHVYTLGKSGQETNILFNEELLKKINASFYKINRGGDITYHGPGQIVGYPIFDLEVLDLSVKSYINKLEESIILTLKDFSIDSSRLENATGVWLDADIPGKARKICAIGVRTSRYISMHGFALNVLTDLNYFSYINPCGFIDKGVTSLSKELGNNVDLENVKKSLQKNLCEVFDIEIGKVV